MKILTYRKEQEKTQQQCADELGIHVKYFSDLERRVLEPGKKLTKKIIIWSGGKITLEDLFKMDTDDEMHLTAGEAGSEETTSNDNLSGSAIHN